MKLTKNKWANFVILKITEGLGIVFIPYLIVLIPLTIWPELSIHRLFDSISDIWCFGLLVILLSFAIGVGIWGIICINLDWAKDLKRDKK